MPVEAKVKASTAAAALSGLALWALGRYVFRGEVPDVVVSWVYVIVPSVITFAAGYLARHTARPGDPPAFTTTPSTRVTWPETQAAAPPSGAVQDRPGSSGPVPPAQPPAAHP